MMERKQSLRTQKVAIEEATPDDLKGLLVLVGEYQKYDVVFAKRYYDLYFKKDPMTADDKVFVARTAEGIVGVIGLCRDYFESKFSYWIGWFVVNRGNRRKGIGKGLFERVEKEARRKKVKKLFVNTEDTNSGAKQFYSNCGFRSEGVLRDYYGKGEDVITLGKAYF
jgi:ribosomal protein S18 acetylase RimI-like enzyme